MTTVTREQLLELDSDALGELINLVPTDLQDQIMALLADLLGEDSIEIPTTYLEGIIDNL